MTKELVARTLAKKVKNYEVIGLGSGSTAELAVLQIGERIKNEKLQVTGVPTSHRIALCAQAAGIQVLSSITPVRLDWAFDGADEVDANFNMIKGRGAAMLSEKIIAKRAGERLLIIVSEEKIVDKLGSKFPVPIEIIPQALGLVEDALQGLGASEIVIREGNSKYGPTISEHNNLILDVKFKDLQPALEAKIKNITGVVESGLFVGATKEILVSKPDGVWAWKLSQGKIEKSLLEGV